MGGGEEVSDLWSPVGAQGLVSVDEMAREALQGGAEGGGFV